jgi:hypothetical protein
MPIRQFQVTLKTNSREPISFISLNYVGHEPVSSNYSKYWSYFDVAMLSAIYCIKEKV